MASPAVNANAVAVRRVAESPVGNPDIPDIRARWFPPSGPMRPWILIPEACGHCQHRLQARDTVGPPRRHQVTELPAIEALITEYRCHRLRCRACGRTTQAPVPDEIQGQFGPQLTALIAYLTVVCRLPRLVVQRLLEGALQIPISLGSTQKAWEEASAAVGAPYEETPSGVARPTRPQRRRDWASHERGETLALVPGGAELSVLHDRDLARV